tara:strand:- start:16742 stop:17959 length:1218 start_codon:yes stop_codon:yes gene_type:complete
MLKEFKELKYIFPKEKDLDFKSFVSDSALIPFSNEVISYLNDLSKLLYKDARTRNYPDVSTFAFFVRKSNLFSLKKEYFNSDINRLGRGIVFHIAPSNVPVNFAYSLVSSLLAGNTNIVRVPSKSFDQVNIISDAILELSKLKNHKKISDKIMLISYPRNDSANSFFSKICDVRVIWGGDNTIRQIRESDIPPRSFDLTFADRYSICIINADSYVDEKNPEKIALNFYNDTYLFDQNACTAPHLVIWIGKKKNVINSKNIFWDNLHVIANSRYDIQSVIAVDKLTALHNQAIKSKKLKKIESKDNLVVRVEIDELPKNIDEFRCSSGYFNEYHASNLIEISPIIDQKYQTIAHYGVSKKELNKLIESNPKGIDRIVKIGKTTDFSLTWDGYNLIDTLSRIIDIKD